MPNLMVALFACSHDPDPGTMPSAPSFPEPPVLEDNNAADGRFEGEITAEPATLDITGEPVEFLTFNGTIPGPQVRVGVGDEVAIHFENDLPMDEEWPSGIHWHGIEGFNASDGTPISQMAVMPGESFDYAFVASRPGVFWYHPHIRGAQAIFSGLYGPLVVQDPAEPELADLGILPADERVVVLSDTWTAQGRVT